MIYWNSLGDFLAMGGYAFYVWGSFLVTLLIMTIEPILALRGKRTATIRLRRQLRADLIAADPLSRRQRNQ